MNTTKSISVSSLTTLLNCPRKFFYSHEMRWKPIAEAEQLTFGKVWHSWLEFFGKSSKDYSTAFSEFLGENEAILTNSINDDALAMFIAMALEYKETAKTVGFIEETETPFSFRLPSTRWRVDGVIDAIGENGCPIEYKTTSASIGDGDFYWLRLKANLQAITYALATNANRVLYVVARKPRVLRKNVPLLDVDGKKIVTYSDGKRAFNANGTPRQTGGEGLTVEVRKETNEEFIARMREDLRTNVSFVTKEVDVGEDIKMLAIDSFVAGVRQIDELRKLARKSSRLDSPFVRNCSEWNCKNCPYSGICLDCNVNPTLGIPNGFIIK